ncbi:hypothetical protein FLL45_18840 [Aliikangiella marina]|uniref:Uncharacterized protein n=1 Tax=Aliikangiella marina TaxID=1712262 RepID=A0A545T4V9_9GAMM|nr:hypothetical protein [Aliikangiella marina]TQV72277.1 hypothetical protein FLL45_18840 [Aliikangiella marina]
MKHLTRVILLTTVNILLFSSLPSHSKSLSSQASQLKFALGELQLRRNDPARQKAFLAAFPKNARDFNRLFNSASRDELWDGNPYIFELESVVQNNPQQGFEIVLGLASQLTWAPDAPNYLQFALMKISIDNPFEFAKQYEGLSEKQRKNVVKFLTESKNGPAVGYRQLIGILKRVNKKAVAQELEKAL